MNYCDLRGFIVKGFDSAPKKYGKEAKIMAIGKVKQLIKKLSAEKLTDEEIRIIKEHHEYHEDKQVKIIGFLPHKAVFIRLIDRFGYQDSVIDSISYKNDCTEDGFVRDASEEKELRFIKKWLKDSLTDEEFQKLKREGKL